MAQEQVVCAACSHVLTAPITRLPALPLPREDGEHGYLPTVDEGRWACDPEPELGDRKTSPLGHVVVNPLDALDLAIHPDPARNSGCCASDGCGGPNRLCPECGATVATLSNDCWTAAEIRFERDVVRVEPAP